MKKCPNCGYFELQSKRSLLAIGGIAGLITAAFFLIFLVTWPLSLVAGAFALVCFAAAPFAKGAVCKHCKYQI